MILANLSEFYLGLLGETLELAPAVDIVVGLILAE
jgi:hypothetical protein